MVNDHTTDILIQIKNAYMVDKKEIKSQYTKLNENILDVLESEGYVRDHVIEEHEGKKYLKTTLVYRNGVPAVSDIKIVSSPGLRIYKSARQLTSVKGGLGIAVLTTSRGIMTDTQARKKNIGGQVLFQIW